MDTVENWNVVPQHDACMRLKISDQIYFTYIKTLYKYNLSNCFNVYYSGHFIKNYLITNQNRMVMRNETNIIWSRRVDNYNNF